MNSDVEEKVVRSQTWENTDKKGNENSTINSRRMISCSWPQPISPAETDALSVPNFADQTSVQFMTLLPHQDKLFYLNLFQRKSTDRSNLLSHIEHRTKSQVFMEASGPDSPVCRIRICAKTKRNIERVLELFDEYCPVLLKFSNHRELTRVRESLVRSSEQSPMITLNKLESRSSENWNSPLRLSMSSTKQLPAINRKSSKVRKSSKIEKRQSLEKNMGDDELEKPQAEKFKRKERKRERKKSIKTKRSSTEAIEAGIEKEADLEKEDANITEKEVTETEERTLEDSNESCNIKQTVPRKPKLKSIRRLSKTFLESRGDPKALETVIEGYMKMNHEKRGQGVAFAKFSTLDEGLKAKKDLREEGGFPRRILEGIPVEKCGKSTVKARKSAFLKLSQPYHLQSSDGNARRCSNFVNERGISMSERDKN